MLDFGLISPGLPAARVLLAARSIPLLTHSPAAREALDERKADDVSRQHARPSLVPRMRRARLDDARLLCCCVPCVQL